MTEEEQKLEADKFFEEYAEECEKQAKEDRKLKNNYKKQLKGLINISGLFKHLEEMMDGWTPIGIVDIELIEERNRFYPNNQLCKVINDDIDRKYIRFEEYHDVRGINHYFNQQTTGYLGDDYYGYTLYPLKNGKYFKVSYSC